MKDGGPREPLRVGVLLDGPVLSAWAAEMLNRLLNAEYATLCVVVENAARPTKKSIWRRIVDNRRRLLYLAYDRVEHRLSGSQAKSLQQVDCREKLADIPTIAVVPDQGKFVDRFSSDDVERVRSHKPDVLIRLGFRILRGDVLKAARYGVWSLHHGDNRVNRGMPPAFWETLQAWPETGVVLQVLSDELDGGTLLFRSTALTLQPFVLRNLEGYNWKAMLLIPRMLERLSRLGEEAFFADVQRLNEHPDTYSGPLYTVPSNRQMAKLLWQHAVRTLRRKIVERISVDQWQLLFSRDGEKPPAGTLRRFKPIVPPRDRFWADPHAIDKDGSTYVFFEELEFRNPKGHISVIEIDESGNVGKPERVLEKPYHLSYPFLLQHNDTLFMIPETMENGTIELYECETFPNQWRFAGNLMEDVRAVDATVHYQDGYWWLFANVAEHAGASLLDELFVFFAEEFPTQSWKPHSLNPVVSSVSRSRPAGALFKHGDRLYRPSQDSSGRYGRAINLMEITRLTPDSYEERRVTTIEPNWRPDLLGTHTLSMSGSTTVIDAQVRRHLFSRDRLP